MLRVRTAVRHLQKEDAVCVPRSGPRGVECSCVVEVEWKRTAPRAYSNARMGRRVAGCQPLASRCGVRCAGSGVAPAGGVPANGEMKSHA